MKFDIIMSISLVVNRQTISRIHETASALDGLENETFQISSPGLYPESGAAD